MLRRLRNLLRNTTDCNHALSQVMVCVVLRVHANNPHRNAIMRPQPDNALVLDTEVGRKYLSYYCATKGRDLNVLVPRSPGSWVRDD